MSDFETVSVERKGRPLSNALRSERERLDLDREEQILLGLSSFLSNGPGKQLSRDGEINEETAEELLKEAKAARRAGIKVNQDQSPEEIYGNLCREVNFLEREDERAFFESACLGEVEISGRSPADNPLNSEAEVVYMNIDRLPEQVSEDDSSLEDAAFTKAKESGLEFLKRSEGSEVYWSELSTGDYERIAFPDYADETVGKLMRREGYAVTTFSEVQSEYGIDAGNLEDEEKLPSLVDDLALCYIVDSGDTAEEYGIEVRDEDRMFETYLAAFTREEVGKA